MNGIRSSMPTLNLVASAFLGLFRRLINIVDLQIRFIFCWIYIAMYHGRGV